MNLNVFGNSSRSISDRTPCVCPDGCIVDKFSSLFDRSTNFSDRSKSPKIVPVPFPSGRPIFRPDGCFRRIFRHQPDKKKNPKRVIVVFCVLGIFLFYDEIEFIHGIKKSLNIILGLNVILWLMIFYDCYGQFNLCILALFLVQRKVC